MRELDFSPQPLSSSNRTLFSYTQGVENLTDLP